MHLIIDIRSPHPIDPLISLYASAWGDLWIDRHPTDRISYLHLSHQDCPSNGSSLIVAIPSPWLSSKKIKLTDTREIYRCVSWSSYPPYDPSISTIIHHWDHRAMLYPELSPTIRERLIGYLGSMRQRHAITTIVPALSIGQEAIEITATRESDIEIIPYISLEARSGDRHILSQLGLSGQYWLYDGSYGSESGIETLLRGYRDYRDLGGTHSLVLAGYQSSIETRRIALQIQSYGLTGSVRIIGAQSELCLESLYSHASGWIYVGDYYSGGPRIELARAHHLPILISHIPSLVSYHHEALTLHMSEMRDLGSSLLDLEGSIYSGTPRSNDAIMQAYEAVISRKR